MVHNIFLVCQNGASTTILVEKMLEAARNRDLEVVINAYPENKLELYIDDADIVLLAPQIRHRKKEIINTFKNKNIPFMSVEPVDYGMMDGDKVLSLALEEINKDLGGA